MIPLIVVSKEEKKTKEFLSHYIQENNLFKKNTFQVEPENKEISIDQIREINKRVSLSFTETQLYIFYKFETASYEAQNAFLKTLEEHNEKIQFILVVDNYQNLLPTILSRSKLVILDSDKFTVDSEFSIQVEKFLESGDLRILKEKFTDIKILDKWLYFFENRLARDKKASLVIREIINVKHLITGNHLDPQLAHDHLMIFIRNQYA